MPPARLPRPVRRRKPLTRRPGDRRGAVLALVAIMMVVLLGFTAIAVDGSYLFVTKAQLQTVADAAAHAAAVEISKDRKADAAAVALAFSAQNKADGKTNTVVAGRITPGHWDDRNTPAFAPRGSWADADVNAAQAVARTDVGLYFARIFGPTSSEVGATGVAAVGSLSSTGCAKPWALAYQTLLWAAGRTNTADLSPLTAAEVDRLTDGTREIMFKVGPGEQAVDVEGDHRLGVQAELRPGPDLEELLERPDPAG